MTKTMPKVCIDVTAEDRSLLASLLRREMDRLASLVGSTQKALDAGWYKRKQAGITEDEARRHLTTLRADMVACHRLMQCVKGA